MSLSEEATSTMERPIALESDLLSSTKACVSCRALKVRCIVESTADNKICQRCSKSDRPCVFTAPRKRKQRKRTDTRVADLEKEILVMKRSLRNSEEDGARARGPQPNRSSAPHDESPPSVSTVANANSLSEAVGISPLSSLEDISPEGVDGVSDLNNHNTEHPFNERAIPQPDLPGLDTLPIAAAIDLFKIYNNDLVEHYPVVIFPQTYSVEDLRAEKPTLFLAVMAAAAMKSQPQLSTWFNKCVLQSYATRIFVNTEKSLELVQSMIVTAVWYYPPHGSSQAKYYEYIHMAATMALDIGLGSRPSPAGRSSHFYSGEHAPVFPDDTLTGFMDSAMPPSETDSSNIENRRTLLACYMICCGVSLNMRRPNLLRYNSWIAECVEHLQVSSAAAPSDKRLVVWVRLLSIAEEISVALSFEDLKNIAKISDPQTQLVLKKFQKKLSDWRKGVNMEAMNGSIEILYHHINIYLHEIALHGDHSPEDFKPPFHFEKIRFVKASAGTALRYMDSIIQCVSSAHKLVEIFLHMNPELLRTLPIFNYIRLLYAIFVLEMISVSADTSNNHHDGFLNRESLQIDHYLPLVTRHLELVVGHAKCVLPLMFLRLLVRLQDWHRLRERQSTADSTLAARSGDMVLVRDSESQSRESIQTPLTYPSGTTSQVTTVQCDGLQELGFDYSAMANYTTDDQSKPMSVNELHLPLDTSSDYQMDLDSDGLFSFGGIEAMGTDTSDWSWHMNVDLPSQMGQAHKDTNSE